MANSTKYLATDQSFSSPLETILDKLENNIKRGKQWQAPCPAHDDRKASLSISTGEDGRVLLHCHAGCTPKNIMAAIGLSLNDLFPSKPSQSLTNEKRSNGTPNKRIAATYDYRDEQGHLLFQAVRHEPKGFTQRRPEAKGKWIYNLDGVRRVLYRLPELLSANLQATVFIGEGEKDVDCLCELDLVATTNPQGAGKWRDEHSQHLKGRDVVILPDNDKAGYDHAQKVAQSLYRTAASIKILALPGLPEKGDVSDWLKAGGEAENLCVLAENAPEWTPATIGDKPPKLDAPPLLQTWSEFSAVERKRGEAIIHELERGEIGMLAAVTNVGKSTLIRNLAISLAAGHAFSPLSKGNDPRRVLLLDFETRAVKLQFDIATMLAYRSSYDRKLIGQNLAICCDGMIGDEPLTLSNKRHLDYVRMHSTAFKADLIIVDTIAAAFESRDENNNAEVTARILKPLVKLAKESGAAVLYAHHIGKARSEEGHAAEKAYRARGASSFAAFASIVLNLTQDASNTDRVTLSLAKVKGDRFDDVNLNLDRASRWFAIAGAPLNSTRTSYQAVLDLLHERGEMKTHAIIAALSGDVAERTVKQCLKDGLNRGDLDSPKRGIFTKVQKVQSL